MGIIVAMIVAVAGAFGAAHKDGMFQKGADTTRRDTYAFERNALEMKLARVESKQRNIVELNGTDAKSVQMTAQLSTTEEKLKSKITALKQQEDKMNQKAM